MEREKHIAAGGSQLAQCIEFPPYIIHFLEYLYTRWNALTNEMHQMTLLAGEIISVLLTAPQKVLCFVHSGMRFEWKAIVLFIAGHSAREQKI